MSNLVWYLKTSASKAEELVPVLYYLKHNLRSTHYSNLFKWNKTIKSHFSS